MYMLNTYSTYGTLQLFMH